MNLYLIRLIMIMMTVYFYASLVSLYMVHYREVGLYNITAISCTVTIYSLASKL